MRPLLWAAIVLVVALLFSWWARDQDAARTTRAEREGSGEPAAATSTDREGSGVSEVSAEPEPATPSVSGSAVAHTIRVVDEAGAPIAGGWVEVRQSANTDVSARATTDGLGRAAVPLDRGEVLFVGARGFMRAYLESVPRLGIEEVTLRHGYDIAGVVVDGDGEGIGGVSLRLVENSLPERATSSGPLGRFAFDDVGDQEMNLWVEVPGHLDWHLVTPGDKDIRIVIREKVSITGAVVFPDGTPASGAKVNGIAADPNGRFTIGSILPGSCQLWATVEAEDRRWEAKAAVDVAADGTYAPIRLALEPLPRSWINVRVVERDGSPSGGVLVGSPLIGGGIFPKTGADGRVALALDVALGTKTSVSVVGPRKDGLLPGRALAVTGARVSPDVMLSPRDPLLVTVAVRGPDGGALPTGVTANVNAFGNAILRRDRDTAVVAIDPLASEFSVVVTAPGFADGYIRGPVPADGYVEVRLRGTGTIECRLADGQGPAVRDVPVGHAIVTAGHSHDLLLARAEADVRAGEVTDLGTLVLGSPLALSGRVTDANGRPVGGARVYAVEGDTETRVFSRSDGTFRVEVAPWFDGFVLASKPGHGSALRRASETLDLVMPSEGKVRLEVRMPPLKGASRGWSLAARDPATGFQWSLRDWQSLGDFTELISGLPPGRLILVVETVPKSAETEVVVVAGQTVSAVIELPE
ncbi:MAG TPA: carboxypeptidase-like regulatory domain-containing protein [Planctomycetota bacterium]|nr:carboxypeptidase-like regulatory domain-containing protein [Planctomycetota bacterium]